MKPVSPEVRKPCYLSGMDWCMAALDRRMRAGSGAGNLSQIVLALRGRPDADVLRERLAACIARHPVLCGRCRRNPFNLAPYWSIPRAAVAGAHLLDARPEASGDEAGLPAALTDAINRPLPDRLRIAFTLVPRGDLSFLAMRFDHRLLDAGGAEQLLVLFSKGEDHDRPMIPADRGAHLNAWRDKFSSGRAVNRMFLALRGPQPPAMLPLPRGAQYSRFVFRSFTRDETASITRHAEKKAGYLMLLPFLLSTCVRAFHELCRRSSGAVGPYIIPVTMDMRRARQDHAICFNHLSFLFYRFAQQDAENLETLCKQSVEQMYRQTRERTAHHLAEAAYLMRILPAAWLNRLMSLPLSGSLGSFSFALVAGEGYTPSSFLGFPVTNAYHMPRVPAPPGMGLFFTRHQGRLNLVLSYLENLLSPDRAEALAQTIAGRLREAKT